LRNDVERCIFVYGDSCRGTRHRRSESDEVARGRGRRLAALVLHKDLAGCVVQHKINTDLHEKVIAGFVQFSGLFGKILTKVIPNLCEIFNCTLFPLS